MNATEHFVVVYQALQSIVGASHVRDGFDVEVEQARPLMVASPSTEEEVSAVMKVAAHHGLVVAPAGGMTHQCVGRSPSRVDVLLDLRRLNSVLHYDPGDLTIGVEAGVPVGELEATLEPNSQLLPLDVPEAHRTTVGGALATALHGPLKHGFGGARDFCVGIRFVTADGTIAKSGGRVVKNVAGYDIAKLLIGSLGTLAVITSANFKLFPRPRQTRAFIAEFITPEEAQQYRDFLLKSPLQPIALEVISPLAESHLNPMINAGKWQVILRASGSDAVIRRYRLELGNSISSAVGGDEEMRLWKSIADFPSTAIAAHPDAMLLRVNVPMRNVAPAMKAAEMIAADNGFFLAAVGRAIGSLFLAFVPIGERISEPDRYAEAVGSFRAQLPPDGSAVVWRCPAGVKPVVDVWGSTCTSIAAMRVVKEAMDPSDILNRGRFLF